MTDQEKKEKRIEINKEKSKVLNCECGMTYTKGNKARHEKSKFHQKYISPPISQNITININTVSSMNISNQAT